MPDTMRNKINQIFFSDLYCKRSSNGISFKTIDIENVGKTGRFNISKNNDHLKFSVSREKTDEKGRLGLGLAINRYPTNILLYEMSK